MCDRLVLLSAAQQLLPRAASESLLQRSTMEELTPGQAAHTIAQCMHAYPRAVSSRLQPSGEQLLVCCDRKTGADAATPALPCAVSFSEYLQGALQTDGGTVLPALPKLVHPISAPSLSKHEQGTHAVLSANLWATAHERTFVVRTTDGAVATFTAGSQAKLTVHSTNALHCTVHRQHDSGSGTSSSSAQPDTPDAQGVEADSHGDGQQSAASAQVRSDS